CDSRVPRLAMLAPPPSPGSLHPGSASSSSSAPRPAASAIAAAAVCADDGEDDGHHQHLARPLSQHPPGLLGPPSQHAVQDSRGLPSQHAQGHPGLFSQHATAAATPMEEPCQHTAGRHVLFADALGLPLARWRRYQPWPPPSPESPPEVVPSLASLPPSTSTPYLLPSFVLQPVGQDEDEKLERLRQAKVELEEVLPPQPGEPRVLRGTVRVLNVSYHKAVHVRASKDRWQSHRDYPALYISGGSPDGGLTDRFAFCLEFGDEDEEDEEGGGARLDFVVRYQTEEGVYWANNQGKNYSVVLKGAASADACCLIPLA
uniref:CBM21 domain-containing protein n=1 Tax=Naja naja TaxID=35670 RepID=A0A8C6YL62_NAJNA